MNEKHLGSDFDDFLQEEGLLEEVEEVGLKEGGSSRRYWVAGGESPSSAHPNWSTRSARDSDRCAEQYGQIRADLEREGRLIGPNEPPHRGPESSATPSTYAVRSQVSSSLKIFQEAMAVPGTPSRMAWYTRRGEVL